MALALTDIILLADPDVASQSRGPAVEGGKMLYTSPSAIQTADSCAEKWRLKYVERLKDDGPSGAQLIGTQIDEQIAHFIATGQNAMGPLASLGLERGYLPKPGKGVYSQVKSDEAPVPLKAAGVPLVWAIDIYDENTRRIIDVKTSSDPVKWGAKKGELLDPATKFGTQMIIYGKAIWEQATFSAAVPLTLEHITFKTKGAPDVFHTVEKTTFGAVSEAFKSIEARVERMKEIAASGEAEKNYDRCHDFGRRCAYFDRCHSTTQRLLAGFTGGNMGLFKELAAKNGTTQIDLVALATPKAAGVVPPDAPANAAAPKQVIVTEEPPRPRHHLDMENSTTIAWTCRCSASFNSQNGLAAHLQELGAKTTPIVLEPAQALALAPAVNPPEGGVASATWPGKGEPTGPDAEGPAPATKKRARPKAPDTTLPQVPAVVADPPSPAAAAGPGAIPPVPTAPIPSPQAPPPSASIGAPLDSPTPGVRIFLNCFPNAPTTSLLPYIEQLQKDICAVAKLPDTDFRCVDTKPLNFGAWQGYLASAVKLSPPPPGSYSASSGDARVAVVISALEGILPAGSVVKGVA